MFDVFMDYVKNILRSRLWPIVFIFAILFGVLVTRMYRLQVMEDVGGTDSASPRTPETREINGIRANIYDEKDNLLAYNELSYAITFEDRPLDSDMSKDELNRMRNEMIHNMIRILEENGNDLKTLDEFPIKIDTKEDNVVTLKEGTVTNELIRHMAKAGNGKRMNLGDEVTFEYGKKENFKYTVKDGALQSFLREAFFKKSAKELTEEQKGISAEDLFHYFRTDVSNSGPRFDIGEEYTNEEALKIMSVRYALMVRTEKYLPITVATNVNEETVAAISENKADIVGVDVTMDTHRVYNETPYLSHILGYTGKISAEELEDQEYVEDGEKKNPYNSNDQIGKSGIEKYFESTLRGKKGSENILLDAYSRVTDITDRIEPKVGKDVYLTIDSELQKACYTILEKKLAGILLSKINNSKYDVGTKGESSNDIKIPIYEVYYALIKNNAIDVAKFEGKDATDLEKSVYQRFLSKQKSVMNSVHSLLDIKNKTPVKNLGEDSQKYLDYIFDKLLENKVILRDKVGTSQKGQIYRLEDNTVFYNKSYSLSEALTSAIDNYQIDLELLNMGKKYSGKQYYSTEELYKRLLKYIQNMLKSNNDFHKMLYQSMIFSDQLTGREICLLLYEQSVLQYEEEKVNQLKSGSVSPYEFLRSKIKKLEITPAMLALEPCSGSIVITDVKTGQIKALVSYPGYDGNQFANAIDADYYTYVTNNSASLLLNRPMQQSTAPGSTFKMVTSIAALEEGVIDLNSTIYDEVEFRKVVPSPRCWSTSSHKTINVINAIRHSCNYFFYELGYRMSSGSQVISHKKGLAMLEKYAKKLGFGETSGVELLESKPRISDTDAIRSAIGQGTNNYTPVQLSRYVTTIANKGYCNELTIVNAKKSKLKKSQSKKKATRLNVKDSTWDAVWQGMRKVVSEGTISPLYKNLKVNVAGKTGTAQESKSKPNHALFVSFAPYENPEITVTAVIPNGYTSSNAAELARDVYRYYFDSKENKDKLLSDEVSGPELDGQAFSD